MSKIKGKIFLIVIILVLIVVLSSVVYWKSKEKKEREVEVQIENRFDSKIVYTSNLSEPKEPLIEHCEKLGGIFNECGTICAPDVTVCVTICAYTCENISPKKVTKDDLIFLAEPKLEEKIESPLVVKGEAKGQWYFEANFPVILTDWDGKIIAETYAQAQGDWTIEDFVPFVATFEFESPYKEGDPDFMRNGNLILQKANPSGLSENDNALEIRIRFK